MTDWNPNDPDAARVFYDLSRWTFDQQAELAAALADAEIPHGWDGTELVVPEDVEDAADLLIADVEARLGIPSADVDDEAFVPAVPIELVDDADTTEYDLGEWEPGERQSLTHALTGARVPFRWEGAVVLVSTSDEAVVDALLDDIEAGEYADTATGDGAREAAPELLTQLFLAAERLRGNPLDPDGIEQLERVIEEIDPDLPPFGVTPRLWSDACELAEQVVDALVVEDGPDEEAAQEAAEQLHDLLRPSV
jgi:hypothetical protein